MDSTNFSIPKYIYEQKFFLYFRTKQIPIASDSEPPPWRKNSARKRARISEFPRKIRANRMGVPSARPFLGFEETAKYYSGVSIVPSPNLFSKS
jgi:hypothetical protein